MNAPLVLLKHILLLLALTFLRNVLNFRFHHDIASHSILWNVIPFSMPNIEYINFRI